MTASELRQKYLDFFKKKEHKTIPSAPLVPENDPTALFNSAGMQPLVPYLLGQPHPLGKRLASVQKCLRTDDIDEVGDTTHHTFFEMLGNWSLGDYFKKEAIKWSYEFLTSKEWLNVPKEKLAISVFSGDKDAPFDQESYDIWISLGFSKERIAKLPKKNNWWGPAGQIGPCGPDTEMFYWSGKGEAPKNFDPEDPKWVEIWNDVFMEYNKTAEGKFELLKQKNVDTGMGVERTLAVLNGLDDDYKTELFWPIIQKIEEISGKKYEENKKAFRIITDHIKAAVFMADAGVEPSNKLQGYVMRRLIRRAVVKMRDLNVLNPEKIISAICPIMIDIYKDVYFKDQKSYDFYVVIGNEANKFLQTLDKGLKEYNKRLPEMKQNVEVAGMVIFDLYQTYGFPVEITKELLEKEDLVIDLEGFLKAFYKHRDLSRAASAGMFKGGLADNSEITTKYHTATHLLHAALRQILGVHVKQEGSNITAERMRFDFSHPEKLTEQELKKIEDLVNEKIKENLPVTKQEMSKDEALKSGALGFFVEKYADKVNVYSVGSFSREICGGPHVDFTSRLKSFKIIKEEGLGQGKRRIYAKVG